MKLKLPRELLFLFIREHDLAVGLEALGGIFEYEAVLFHRLEHDLAIRLEALVGMLECVWIPREARHLLWNVGRWVPAGGRRPLTLLCHAPFVPTQRMVQLPDQARSGFKTRARRKGSDWDRSGRKRIT